MDFGRLQFQGSGTLTGDEPSLVVKAATANRSQGVAHPDDHFNTKLLRFLDTAAPRIFKVLHEVSHIRQCSVLGSKSTTLQSTC